MGTESKRISVIIPITGKWRHKHAETSIYMLRQQTYKNFEIVLVEQIDCAIAKQRSTNKFYEDIGADKYIAITNEYNYQFNQPWMGNVGAKLSDGDRLVFFDIDLWVEPDYLEALVTYPEPFFFAWETVIHLNQAESEAVHKNKIMKHSNAVQVYQAGTKGHMGYATCADRDFFFEQLGCYSENFFGWGGNDQDICCRAKNLIRKHIPNLNKTIYHLWHPRGYAQPSPVNRNIVFATRMFPEQVTQRLQEKSAELGNPKKPTVIYMKDLIIKMRKARGKR